MPQQIRFASMSTMLLKNPIESFITITGRQELCRAYRDAFSKLLNLTLNIQDDSPEKQFAGCWRGMFDLESGTWGGGDCYEGGAGSIYSGWTNAPIAWTMAFEILKTSLLLK